MINLKDIFIVWALLVEVNAVCPGINSTKYGVTWPSTSNWTLSNPPCVGNNKEFVYRRCLEDNWGPEPDCYYVQQETPPECPENFLFSKQEQICYQVTREKSKFPPECPYKDVIPFNSYKSLVDNLGPFWVPVQRDVSNGLGFMQWLEASSVYKTEFKENYIFGRDIKRENCLLFYNTSYIVSVSCNEEHLGVCAYPAFSQLPNQLCGDSCQQSDFSPTSKCFCFGNTTQNSSKPRVPFLHPYQNTNYKKITNLTCSIDLEKTDQGTYIWKTVNQEISYTFWSPDAVFDNTFKYGAATPTGWILTQEPTSCYLYQNESTPAMKPTLELKFSLDFTLELNAPEYMKQINSSVLLYCFTDANATDLLFRLDDLEHVGGTYSFTPLSTGPGTYWCESFDLDMNIIKSNSIFVRNQQQLYEFVAIFKMIYSSSLNPLSAEITEFISTRLFDKLSQMFGIKDCYTPRLMKIVDVDQNRRTIWINTHFTSTFTSSTDLHDGQYEQLKARLTQYVNNNPDLNTTMEDFSSVDFCMEEILKLCWHKTKIGHVSFSTELCFRKDGCRVSRTCEGNFIDGAHWAPVDEDCDMPPFSSVTENLTKLIDNLNDTKRVVTDVQTVAQQNWSDFQPVDLYVVALIYQLVSPTYNDFYCVINSLTITVDNLLKIDPEIFSKSQTKMRAIDNILLAIKKIVTNEYISEKEYLGENFFIMESNFATLNGYILNKNDSYYVEKLSNQTFIEGIHDALSAIVFSPELRNQTKPTDKFTIAIFCKTSLFHEQFATKKINGAVFAVFLPESYQNLNGPIQMVLMGNQTQDCVMWNYNQTITSSWIETDETTSYSLYQYCNFTKSQYFAFLTPPSDNVTEILNDILESNATATELMTKLNHVSKRYNEFGPNDIFLVGRILNKVHNDKTIDLTTLAETISNIHRIKREILRQSQVDNKSTDVILDQVDKIIKNHHINESWVQVISDNLKIWIANVKETDFSGLVFLGDIIQLLQGDIDIEDVAAFDNLTLALVLSPELKNQLQSDGSNVIVTYYSSDALFNQQASEFSFIGKILGLVLTENRHYSGPISVLHKIDQPYLNQKDCVHWHYNQTVMGSWYKDQYGKRLASLIHCKFWHTTHFALLLLDLDELRDDPVLSWITYVTCSLSLLGLFCIILTALFFQKWRNNTGNILLLNFSLVMAVQIVTFLISSAISTSYDNYLTCTIIGIILHYSTLAEFCWMLILAYLQFQRFVIVLGTPPQNILLKSCLFAWVLPLFPVTIVISADKYNYVKSATGICYPSDLGLYLGVWLPVSLIVFTNLILFVYIAESVFNGKTKRIQEVGTNEAVLQWRLTVSLFFLLGLTWMFGFLSELGDIGTVFVYLFCCTATLQGFVLFVFFILSNKNTREMYWQRLRNLFYKSL